MIILTYIVRAILLLALPPMVMLCYAMYQDVKNWGKE